MTAVVALKLTAPTTQTAAPFAFAQPFVRGDIPSGQFAHIDTPNFSVVPMCYWNDGSLKHAMLIGRVDLSANTQKQINVLRRTVAPSPGTLLTAASITAAAPTATAALTGYGTVSLASLLSSPVRTHISTKEMVECHYKAAVGSDAQLYAWFYVRLYAGGKMEVRVALGNAMLGGASALRSYPVTITIGGTVAFSAGTYYHAAFARYDVKAWIGGDPAITPQHDTGYLVRTGLVPNYLKYADPTSGQLTYLNSINTYAPGANLGFSNTMGGTGYQDDIGLLNRWDGMYIVTKGCKAAYDSVIAGARAINSYAIAFSDATSLAPVKITDYPTWSVYGAAQGGSYGFSTVKQDGTTSLDWEKAHHPSAGYLAYLLTGDFYYFETCQHQARTVFLMEDINGGNGTSRVFRSQNRARGWGYRSMAQAAALIPTWLASQYGDIAAWVAGMSAANITKYAGLTTFQRSLGFEDFYQNRGTPAPDGEVVTGVGMFEHYFVAQAMGMAVQLEPCDTSGMTSVTAFADHMLGAAVWPLGVCASGSTDFPFPYASQYQHNIPSGGGSTVAGLTATNGDQIYTASFSPDASTILHNPGGNTLLGTSGGDPLIASGYWGNLLPAISYAVQCGKTGAPTAFARLIGASNWSAQLAAGYDDTPNFGIVPPSYAQQPLQFTPIDSGAIVTTPGPCTRVGRGFLASGTCVSVHHGLGIRASEIPTGFVLPAFLANDIIAGGDANNEYAMEIISGPSGGTLTGPDEFSAFTFSGPDGTYGGNEITKINGAANPGTYSFNIGVSSTVTGVTISPPSATVSGGATQLLVAAVAGAGSPSQLVNWTTVAGAVTAGGSFTAPPSTGAVQLIAVTATSTQDPSKSATIMITVPAASATVTSVDISPTGISVVGGTTQVFTWIVNGTGTVSQAVTLSATIGAITPSGAWSAAATTSVQTATITATSVQAPTRSGTATVTIPAIATVTPPPAPVPDPVLPDPAPPVTTASRDLSWLKQAVENWTHRTGFAADPILDDFIMLAEKRINNDLEARLQDAVVTIPTVANLNGVLMPADVAEIRSLSIAHHGPLGYITPDQFNEEFACGTAGPTKFYTIVGPYIYLGPTPDAVYSLKCAYRQHIPSLLDAVDGVNWLIRDQPNIYLAATMCEALVYVQNETQIPVWEAKYKVAVEALNHADWHTGGPLTVKSDTLH